MEAAQQILFVSIEAHSGSDWEEVAGCARTLQYPR